MKSKHIPVRQCIICGKKFEKKELLRISLTEEGISVDITHKSGGRGAYICKNPDCMDKMIKKRGLDRAFKRNVGNEIYEKILNEIDQGR